jgi:tRNA pseudouridine13 synthase
MTTLDHLDANSPRSEDEPSLANVEAMPFLTADLPGIGGVIKQTVEDFVVDEIPAYQPCGEGEHLFLWVEKRGVAAEQLTKHIARTLGISDRDIGVAGLKDRQAVTRQYVSVPAKSADRIPALETDGIHVVSFARHTNKLRTGHLRGNRFTIVVRDVGDDAEAVAQQIAERIADRGFPNYFGSQRFGRDGGTVQTGLDLLTGRLNKSQLRRSRARFLLRLSISAVQSHLFNLALAERLRAELIDRVLAGDVMQVVASGGLFVAEAVAIEQHRFDAGETAVTGPIFGPKMRRPQGEPAVREAAVLHSSGLTIDHFAQFGKLAQGTRRPFLVRPGALLVDLTSEGLKFEFSLPPGVYATTLLREFQKEIANSE